MKKYLTLLWLIFILNIAHYILEVIVSSIFAKLGLPYIPRDWINSSMHLFEIISGTAYFLFLIRVKLSVIYILLTMVIAASYLFLRKEISYKKIVFIFFIVSTLILFSALVYYGNTLTEMWNPLLSVVMSGVLIYLAVSKNKTLEA